MELKGKIALLTGASTGIGKAIAKSMLEKGAKVIVFGLHKPDMPVEFYKVDVSKESEIISAISKIKKIDILVNNAGICKLAKVADTTSEILGKTLDINFKGSFWMAKYSILKIPANGCIINISSTCGLRNYEELGAYSASKAAVISLTKTLAQELAEKKIRSNCIAPGFIDTEMWEEIYGSEGRKMLKECENSVLLKRAGTPEEIASAAIFLCENDYVNGQILVVDGGEVLG